MFKDFLPNEVREAIVNNNIDENKIQELRFRINEPITIILASNHYFLSSQGLSKNINNAIFVNKEMIEQIVYTLTENSLYAVNNQLREGFITTKNGIRVGICGEVVYINNEVQTIKNITSLNIRIPHIVKNCSKRIFDYLIGDCSIYNTLIVAPPGVGKTTFLRDLIYQIYTNKFFINSLVLDERYEISGLNSDNDIELGCFTDILRGVKKEYGFINGIRSMSPDVIFTDEIATLNDIEAIKYACSCGVKIVATIHAKDMQELKDKSNFKELLDNKIFRRFVILSKRKGVGTIEGVYDEEGNLFYRDL